MQISTQCRDLKDSLKPLIKQLSKLSSLDSCQLLKKKSVLKIAFDVIEKTILSFFIYRHRNKMLQRVLEEIQVSVVQKL